MKRILLFLFLQIYATSLSQNKNQSIGFKENKGQIIDQKGKANPAVKYLLNSHGLNVQLKKNGFSYDVYETKKHPIKHSIEEKRTLTPLDYNKEKTPNYTLEYVFHRIDIDFVNSNPNVELVTTEASKDYDNYYNIPNKPEGVVNVHSYQQITYKNIYPNIDVVFSIPKDTLKTVEYNFVVHPKGKISDIQMKFNGAKTKLIDNKIQMNVRFGKMEETLPASWTEDGKEKKDITVSYKKIKNNIYGFEIANAISDKTVIIDPVPVRLWGTYYAGATPFTSQIIRTDNLDNVLIAGETSSMLNTATSGAFQTSITSSGDTSFLGKLGTNGKRIWGTYINAAKVMDLVSNDNNDIYIAGHVFYNYGNNLTTVNAHKKTNPDFSRDGLILKFNADGQQVWGTLFGGTGIEMISAITIDHQNNIIIAGETNSENQIATADAYQTINNDPFRGCGFYAKFSPLGERLYASYFQGKINHLAIDRDNHLIFAGQYGTIDSTHPDISTSGAHQRQVYFIDGFIAKFNVLGQKLWCTYYGGDASFFITVSDYYDRITGLGTDDLKNIYISGITNSTNNIATTAAHKEFQPIGGVDTFITKFNTDGIRQWGTYFGSNEFEGIDKCEGSFTSEKGDIYITGDTRSQGQIATSESYQPLKNSSDEGFISKFDTSGKQVWGTIYGGSNQDYIKDIYVKNSLIYVIGTSVSTNLGTPETEFPFLNDAGNTFITKFQDCISPPEISSNSPVCIGNRLEIKASGGTNYAWMGPNGFTSTLQNPTILNATTLNSGEYRCLITGTGGCDDTKTVAVIVGDVELPIPDIASLPIVIGDCNTVITKIPTATDSCAGAITATTLSPVTFSLPGTYTVVWNYNDGNGNTSTQNQTITISNQPFPTVTSPQTFCIQQNATLNEISITGQNIKWYDNQLNGNQLPNTTTLQNGITYYASQTISGCESERIAVLINIQNTPAPTGTANQSFCSSQNPTLDTIEISGSKIKWYNSAGVLLSTSTSLQDGVTYYASQTENSCESPNKLAVTISLISTLPANNYEELFCDDLNDGSEKVNLSPYNSKLISNTSGYSFSYYSTFSGAENQLASNKINNYLDYKIALGDNQIYVHINSNTLCYAIVELKLTVLPKPIITIPDIVPICENSAITINAGNGYDTYLWSTGETSASIVVDTPGKCSVTVTKNYNTISCSTTKNFEVKKSEIATIISIEIKDWTDNDNVITIYATGIGDFEYSINGNSYQNNNQFDNLLSGSYNVFVRDKNGCGIATDKVSLLMYPKYFTPNGDGYNDTWEIKFSDIEEKLTVQIFDRYGKLITILNQNQTWNGTLNNQQLPATDYWFIVTRADGKELKGHFSLKR